MINFFLCAVDLKYREAGVTKVRQLRYTVEYVIQSQ